MSEQKYIIITGAAGFIGSCLVGFLNEKNIDNLVLVDDFSRKDKASNLQGKKYLYKVHREQIFEWLDNHDDEVEMIIHLGAKTDTTILEHDIFKKLNTEYTKKLYDFCTEKNIRLIYASSAATYGNGELGYRDDEEIIYQLQPMNPYAISKNDIDKYIFRQEEKPAQVVALKFFNVYGPNEYHKGRMASVIFHAYNNILKSGRITLFRSHRDDYNDGEQKRDFIYVKDVVKVIYYMMNQEHISGIYNLGTGQARSFNDLAKALFSAINHKASIQYTDTPENIRDTYQYFTEADMKKLLSTGYNDTFYTLEEGIKDYAHNYLEKSTHW